ncbi:unnamed protein product [Heligmosomoides polygyrus]|uniref:Uncharacterized protein n=1 Tax=Heligmosomoides polygyrus TaxID=6339 RepID=A0A183GD46_HELPZ|nr:unnamed protein product [Heligmosomoides polygyrus]
MQSKITMSLRDFDVELLPSLIELLMRRIDPYNKGAFAGFLSQLSIHLRVDDLKTNRRRKSRLSLDDIVGEVFDKIAQYVVLGGEPRWKEVQRFFRGGPSSEKSGAPDTASQEDTISPDNSASHALSLFDVLLSVTLLALRTCPLSAANAIKQRFVLSQDNIEAMSQLFGNALKFKALCERNVSPMVSIAQQCLWSVKQDAQNFGAKLFKELFLALPKRQEIVMKTMLSHIAQSDAESEAVLRELTDLIDTRSEMIEPYVPLISVGSSALLCFDYSASCPNRRI